MNEFSILSYIFLGMYPDFLNLPNIQNKLNCYKY